MLRTLCAASTIACIVAGCADLRVPVTGQFGGGIAAGGEATARWSGEGDFWIQVPAGPRCSGKYNSLDSSPTIVVPITCTDGRRGETVITRQMNGLSGTAIATLNDGTKGQFVFGDLKFEQAFGSGVAKTGGLNPSH